MEKIFGLNRLSLLHHAVGFMLGPFLVVHPILLTHGHAMQAGSSLNEQFVDFCKNSDDVLSAVISLSIMMMAVVFFCPDHQE
ncbi:MAG: hypothetical protein JW774_11920 [Candidatus Aureabacteria bacterium]|nr:hypothetical protein [Candidatus Auribacterota bacterium]